MPLKIEDKPVSTDPLLLEIIETLPKLKVGQSFVFPVALASAVRNRAGKFEGMRFATRSQGDGTVRIGRVL